MAEAEAEAHGVAPEDVHFHEVGALDALADVAGACALLDALEPERVWTGPVAVGSGRVATEHGPMPVPAPATLRLLRGLPVGGRDLVGERTTPTGAALLRAWEARAGGPPAAVPLAVGHGAGAADPADLPNLLRVVVEEAEGPPEEVRELRVRVDDRSGEEVGAALGAFLAVGALDAWVVPVVGKKGRPAWEVVVLAGEEARPALEEAIFRHLGTLGLRVAPVGRVRRPRRVVEHSGPLGPLPWKERLGQEGPDSRKPEFEALRARAAELGLTPREAAEILAAQDRPEGR
ncbi:MAG: LarC family nickel insertion protein [Planctomycetota bacterium]|nr:MAG: LarC family nickel insertion protein [Planctomycetota bacterium]